MEPVQERPAERESDDDADRGREAGAGALVRSELNRIHPRQAMRRTFRRLALALALAAIATWLATGASRGWTKTSVEKRTPDPVTGLEGITYEKRFVAGVDFLGAALLAAGALAGRTSSVCGFRTNRAICSLSAPTSPSNAATTASIPQRLKTRFPTPST